MSEDVQIALEGVNKHYGAYHALRDVTVHIPRGQFVTLVGPSGCGKSTLLRCIAGLESVTSGELRIAGARINGVPPRKRDLAMVFQSYALYPHMTVRDNLTYALRLARRPRDEIARQADEVARIIGLSELLDRYPRELSGGQRQRVAMGRAIIRNPKAFLFDEPLSNLDAGLRVQMRKEIRSLHDRLGATSISVTHDQVEAMTMSDHVVVMRDGRVEQQGQPLELYERPANRFVAGFLGSPAMNFVAGEITSDGRGVRLAAPEGALLALPAPQPPGRPVTTGFRPEHLALERGGEGDGFAFRVAMTEVTGAATYLFTDTDPELTAVVPGVAGFAAGETLRARLPPEAVHLFEPDTGERLL